MNRQPLISVIVPVYNVEKYVGKCVDSILNQSYKNLDIILVDDGSTDRSGVICDDYAHHNANIRVIHQLNGGLSAARNAGLDVMTGEYVTFVDSDDMIHRECIATLYRYIETERAEISTISAIDIEDDDVCPTTAPRGELKVFYSGVEAVESMLFQQRFIDNSAWGKLYKASFFETHRFPVGILYEDLATIPYVCLEAKCIATSATPLYFYRKRETSILGSFSLKRSDVLDVVDDLVKFMEQNYKALIDAACSRKFSANMNILWLMSATGIKDDAIVARCWENIKQLRKMALINPRVRMKNKLGALTSVFGLDFLMIVLNRFKD